MSLVEFAFRRPVGMAEQRVELRIRHAKAGAVVEIVEVEPERPVILEVDEVVEDRVPVDRIAVGCQPHQLVLAGIDLESGIIGESRIEQAQAVGKVDLPLHLQRIAAAHPDGCRRPFADPVHRQDQGVLERRGEEGRGGMAQMVLGEEELALPVEILLDLLQMILQQRFLEQLLPQPERNRHAEAVEAPRRERQIGFQQALELQERLVIEGHVVDIAERDARLLQAERDGILRISRHRASCG